MPFLRTLIAVGVLTALGYIANVVNLPVAFSVSFLFGSIFVIIAVSLFGPLLGGISALIASSYTYILWNHPYAIIIFVCEALWVGFFLKRKYTNIVLIDAAYWVVMGLPLVFIFYFGVMSVGFQSATIIFLKQSINGIVNALIAGILITHLPLQKWLRLTADRPTVPYRQIIFQLTSGFLMLPLIGMLLFTNYQTSKTMQTVAGDFLVSESKEAKNLIQSWLERHINAIKITAKLGKDHHFRPSENLQTELEQINLLFPDLHNVFVADNTATTAAFIPAINENGETTIGMNFSDREWFKQLKSTLKPVVSDVFQSRATVFVPIFAICVPIVEGGKLSGFGAGAINLNRMRNMLAQSTHHNNIALTIVDHNNNIVCSTTPKNPSLTPIKQKSGGQALMVGKDVGLWTPSSKKHISVMDMWKEANYFVTLPIDGTTWTLLAELPVAPMMGYLYHATIVNLIMIFCLFVVAIILSQLVSKLLAKTPRRLAKISRDIPEKLEQNTELIWPESTIAEMHVLIENFKETTQALGQQYQNIKDANIHLEERVQERTTELRESEEKYRVIFDNEIYAICIFDLETLTLLDANDAYSRVYGYSREELLSGMTIYDITAEQQVSDAATKQAIHEGTIFIPLRYHRKKDGTVFPVEIVGGPYKWKGRKVMFALAHDITDRKQNEDQIKSLLAEKELLLREVHHRIKNNMSVVRSLLSLQADVLHDPSAVAALQDSKNRVQSMMVLYDKLYRSADFRAISANEYLTSLIDEIVANFPNKGLITVQKQIDDAILDSKILSPIGIILNELLTNAMKHAFIGRENGVSGVSLSINGSHVVLIVQDNGVGMPKSIDMTNSTGFGMQLVNILTEQLNGTIRIEREEGTRFVLEFEL